jgi:hypothetical protein
MPPSGALIPASLDRAGTFVVLAVIGTCAALFASLALLLVGVGSDELFWAWFMRTDIVLALAAACGAIVGLAGAVRDTGALRRAAVAALLLLVVGTIAMATIRSLPQLPFSAAAFRSAPDPFESEQRERQAHRAVEQNALIGLSTAELRSALGEPDRIARRSNVWIWDLGMINDFIGPGDGGALYVTFDASWSRVVSAKVS